MEKEKLQKRVRFVPVGMKVREAAEGEESREVEGCAIVFNQETTLWEDRWERVREIIAPSACTQEFIDGQDVKLNMLHDRNLTVARCNKREGNMTIEVREDGVYFRATMPKCDLGDRALEMIRAGVFSGCSFEFYADKYNSEVTKMPDGREDVLITHESFARVSALTIGMDPAYEQTSCSAREFEELTGNERRLKEQEDAEREAKHLLSLRERAAILKAARERVTELL